MSDQQPAKTPAEYVAEWQSCPGGQYISPGLYVRTARKSYDCCRARDGLDQCIAERKEILPGERYIEDVTGAPDYQSGARKHLMCAAQEWARYLNKFASEATS